MLTLDSADQRSAVSLNMRLPATLPPQSRSSTTTTSRGPACAVSRMQVHTNTTPRRLPRRKLTSQSPKPTSLALVSASAHALPVTEAAAKVRHQWTTTTTVVDRHAATAHVAMTTAVALLRLVPDTTTTLATTATARRAVVHPWMTTRPPHAAATPTIATAHHRHRAEVVVAATESQIRT